jgi:hypothetical protein
MTFVLRWLADEDFDADILRSVLRQLPTLDVVRVQDVVLSGRHDTEVLRWAALEDHVLLTHDLSTMKTYAYERIAADLAMPGVFVVSQALAISQAIEAIILVAECSVQGEWQGQVRHLPL